MFPVYFVKELFHALKNKGSKVNPKYPRFNEVNEANRLAKPQIKMNISLLLVVRESQRPDAGVACGVCVEEGEVECEPDLDDAAVTASDQVLAVPGQQDALEN